VANHYLWRCSLVLAAVAVFVGAVGMALSFVFLASPNAMDVTAGNSGFLAGAVLVGSGILSLTVLAARPPRVEPGERDLS
jgi:hypothetical protein